MVKYTNRYDGLSNGLVCWILDQPARDQAQAGAMPCALGATESGVCSSSMGSDTNITCTLFTLYCIAVFNMSICAFKLLLYIQSVLFQLDCSSFNYVKLSAAQLPTIRAISKATFRQKPSQYISKKKQTLVLPFWSQLQSINMFFFPWE